MSTWQRWKDIMKCYPFEESRLLKWEKPYIVQPKYDGDRCWDDIINPNIHILTTSEGNQFFSVPHIQQSLTQSGLIESLDGELYNHNINIEGGHDLIRSITSRTVNLHPRHEEINLFAFDIKSKEIQMQRIIDLNALKGKIPHVQIAPFWLCNSVEEIMEVYEELIAAHYEGIIVRNAYASYEEKRSTFVMKFKPKKSDQYRIVGYEEELSIYGIPKGTLGALVCASGDGNTFNVGTGFTDRKRKELWLIRESLPGQEVLVKYQHITPGRKVPRFPVYAGIV